MCRNDKLLAILICITLVTLFAAQQIAGAKVNNSENTNQEGKYNTVEVKRGLYVETFHSSEAKWMYLRTDTLTIKTSRGTFDRYLVSDQQTVKKGEALLSYRIPYDSITLEEKQKNYKREEEAFSRQKKQRETLIEQEKEKRKSSQGTSLEGEILELGIQKKEAEYKQYLFQTEKKLRELKEEIKEVQSAGELQYLYAPYDGVIGLKTMLKEGASIDKEDVLLSIYDPESLVLGIKDKENKLRYNTKVSVTGIGSSKADIQRIYEGKVIAEDSVLNHRAELGITYIKVENMGPVTDLGKVDISAELVRVEDVRIIPSGVVKKEDGINYVYVLEDGEERKQYITGRNNKTDMWVYDGLLEGQCIIAE